MFEPMASYIQRPLADRRAHLKLTEACVEIGTTYSREYRGLLAHFLKTTLPLKKEAVLCHACHNSGCSNPRHLYWGTFSDNLNDAVANGRPQRKLTRAESKRMLRIRNQKRRYASGEAARLSSE